MEFELSGNGFLELADGTQHRISYYVRSYLELPGGPCKSHGQIDADDPNLIRILVISTDGRLTLILEDGSRLAILLRDSSGAISVRNPKPPAE